MSPIKNMNTEYVLNRSKIQNQTQGIKNQPKNASISSGPSFESVLNKIQTKNEIQFSKHALQRLSDRNVYLTDADMDRINTGVDKARKKGVKEALILMDNKVFVASVKNNIIITAAMEEQLKDNVFTQIDGAVIV